MRSVYLPFLRAFLTFRVALALPLASLVEVVARIDRPLAMRKRIATLEACASAPLAEQAIATDLPALARRVVQESVSFTVGVVAAAGLVAPCVVPPPTVPP